MGLSNFLDLVVALAVILPPMIVLLAFFIWIATIAAGEEEE
jgi:hypothetical protein